jgi:hypothetical protein
MKSNSYQFNKLYFRLFDVKKQLHVFNTHNCPMPKSAIKLIDQLKQYDMNVEFPNYIGVTIEQSNLNKLMAKTIYKNQQISKYENEMCNKQLQIFGLTHVHNKWFVTCNKFTGNANEKLLLDACTKLNYKIVDEETSPDKLDDINFIYSEFGEIKWFESCNNQSEMKFVLNQLNDKISEMVMNKMKKTAI